MLELFRCANFRFSNIDNIHICYKLEQIIKIEKLSHEPNVINTIATLAKGDLRKAINLLQSISMQTEFITNDLCYETAGIPSNYEIVNILKILTNKNYNFNESYNIIIPLIKTQGYSLSFVLKELILELLNHKLSDKMPQIISDLSDLENQVTKSTFGDIYITSLVGIFKKIENINN